jgi:hypothetical protein
MAWALVSAVLILQILIILLPEIYSDRTEIPGCTITKLQFSRSQFAEH